MTLKDLLIKQEDIRLFVYDDETGLPIVKGSVVKGNPTIGVGRLLTKAKGLSKVEVFYLLDNDIQDVISVCRETFSWFAFLDNVRQAVVASMVFNLGLTKFLEFKNTIAAIRDKNWDAAASGMMNSLWAKQVGKRADELAGMMRTGRAE